MGRMPIPPIFLLIKAERFTFLLFYFFTFNLYCTTYFLPFTM